MTRVLSVASECFPLIKTGGLADVVGALPTAVAAHDVDMHTLVPGYPAVMHAIGDAAPTLATLPNVFGGTARVRSGQVDGRPLYVVDAPHLYDRPGNPYLNANGADWGDNAGRFAALSWVAAHIATHGLDGWAPQVLHLHDWQTGLAPIYLRQMGGASRVGTLFTIHNIAFQGVVGAHELHWLRLRSEDFTMDGFEYYGHISALKAGLVFSDRISTVSPTYAQELMRPEFGRGMQGILNERRNVLSGILNGIDTQAWEPPYADPRKKASHKAALQREVGLPEADGPLCVVISRLTEQKGMDLLLEALPTLLHHGGQLAVLGNGERQLEEAFSRAAHDQNVSIHIGYDEARARRYLAGADVILVPSRFEPCGLTQLYGLRFGTLPLVALTGGLADTVVHANAAGLRAGVSTGFQFHPIDPSALSGMLSHMCEQFYRPAIWRRMQLNAMGQSLDWEASSAEYAAIYTQLAARS